MALIEGHEDDFDGRIYSPDEGVRHAMELAKTASKPIIIADTQDNPGAGGDSDTTGMLRALVRNNAIRAATGVIYDPQSAKSRASGRRRRHRDADARRQVRHSRRRAVQGNLRRRESCRTESSSRPAPITAAATWTWGPSACLRIGDVRVVVEFAQGATRRSVDVPLCRHRADRTGDPGQQELGAFPRRFRADRRKLLICAAPGAMPADTADLALDAAASGHPHQAERPCLHAHNQITLNSSVTG